jgi:hypothetical protein
MGVKRQISSFLIVVAIVTIGMLVIGSNFFVNADEARLGNFHSMKKLVQAIEAGKVDNDKIGWEKFRTSEIYQNAGNNTQKCLNLAHKVGDNIADNEIVHCYKNDKYFKQKYSKDNKTNNTNTYDGNNTNNETSADANVTGSISDANVTGSVPDTNATSADANVTGSVPDTNATSADANVTGSSAYGNSTGSDANAISSYANVTGSSADANARNSKYQ